jgi:anthranilate synthase component 2
MKARKPMHGKISKITHQHDPIFSDLPSPFEAVRYNSLILQSAGDLKAIAYSDDEIMAVSHPQYPVWGVQFHPEAAKTKFGLKIISNWLEYNNIA